MGDETEAIERARQAIEALKVERQKLVQRIDEIDAVIFGGPRTNRRSVNVSELTREIVRSSPGLRSHEIVSAVTASYPIANASSVRATLNGMAARGEIRRVKRGAGSSRFYPKTDSGNGETT